MLLETLGPQIKKAVANAWVAELAINDLRNCRSGVPGTGVRDSASEFLLPAVAELQALSQAVDAPDLISGLRRERCRDVALRIRSELLISSRAVAGGGLADGHRSLQDIWSGRLGEDKARNHILRHMNIS